VTGRVFLVGAGPGDPRLLTLRGAEVLQRADVVVFDRLVAPALLDLAPSRAERVDVGKAPGRGPDQAAISELIVDRARRGLDVVRLKGGDPFVFGRGGEEALACARAEVPFEVVPGVSSAIAAPASAGIPVTHRGVASSFVVVTATLADGEANDLARAARAADTLVVLMAAGRLGHVAGALVAAGRSPDEPAAAIEAASTSRQRSVRATLATLPALAELAGIGSPATVVVGQVVALAGELAGLGSLVVAEALRPVPEDGSVDAASLASTPVAATSTSGVPIPERA
jgi:uroporphyrin-III C-methyltransferase